jgi:hypothetical protein
MLDPPQPSAPGGKPSPDACARAGVQSRAVGAPDARSAAGPRPLPLAAHHRVPPPARRDRARREPPTHGRALPRPLRTPRAAPRAPARFASALPPLPRRPPRPPPPRPQRTPCPPRALRGCRGPRAAADWRPAAAGILRTKEADGSVLEAPLAESRAARVAPANAALWEAAAAGDGPGLVAAARAGGSLAAWDFTHGAALSALHYAAIADAVWPPPPPSRHLGAPLPHPGPPPKRTLALRSEL